MDQHFHDKFNSLVEDMIKDYTKVVSEKYSLDFNEVIKLWSATNSSKSEKSEKTIEKKKPTKTEKQQAKINELLNALPKSENEQQVISQPKEEIINIEKMTRTELVGLCRKYSLKISGTKDELLQRVLPHVDAKKVAVAPKKETSPSAHSSIIKKVNQNTSTVEIKRNKFGNYEHTETGLIFDREDKTVIGHQNSDGTIQELDEEMIEQCKKFKFQYRLPENLDKSKTNLKDVKIGGDINEEDLYDEEEEEEEAKDEDEEEEEIFDDE